VGVAVGEGINVGELLAVGLGIGLGEAGAVTINAGAFCDWQAARKTIIRVDIRNRLLGITTLRSNFSTTNSPSHFESLVSV
jgi:hypothetical protein